MILGARVANPRIGRAQKGIRAREERLGTSERRHHRRAQETKLGGQQQGVSIRFQAYVNNSQSIPIHGIAQITNNFTEPSC